MAIEKAFQCSVFDRCGGAKIALLAYNKKCKEYLMSPQYSIVEEKPVKRFESDRLV